MMLSEQVRPLKPARQFGNLPQVRDVLSRSNELKYNKNQKASHKMENQAT